MAVIVMRHVGTVKTKLIVTLQRATVMMDVILDMKEICVYKVYNSPTLTLILLLLIGQVYWIGFIDINM